MIYIKHTIDVISIIIPHILCPPSPPQESNRKIQGNKKPIDRLKGPCHEMDIFFESLNILIHTFCVCAEGFQDPSKAFHYSTYTINNFLFASLKLLTNFENAY